MLIAALGVAYASVDVPQLSLQNGSVAQLSTSLNGTGNLFLTASVIANPGGAAPGSIAVADFNGDGKEDIAATNTGCNTCGLTILRGNGDGTFQTPLFTTNLGGPYYVAAGDFNGDGKQDLAVIGALPSSLTTPAVFILLGNGDGTFTLKTTLTGFTTPNAIALGDFNGDGKLDMAVSQSQVGTGTPSSVLMFLGNGDGTMQAPISTTATGVGDATFMATADFNKDNHLDLVIADLNSSHVAVLLGNGNGTFQAIRSFPITAGGFDVAVGDFNGDGVPDIAATTTVAGTVDILLGKGDGNFQPAVSYNAGELAGPTSYLAVGDFNKDGKLDIIAAIGEAFIAAPSSSVAFFAGKGDGTFMPPVLLATDEEAGQLVVADFNADGNSDWVQGNSHSHVMTLALGNGDGTFQAGVNYALGAGAGITLADINKDGKLDVVAVDPGSNDVRVLPGKGDGTFLPAIITPVTQPYYGIATGDFNNDGNLDIVLGSAAGAVQSRSVIVMLGKGDGTFGPQVNYSTGGGSDGFILVADFNGDGKLDVAVVNQFDNNVAILLGNGDGTFQAPKLTAKLGTDGFLGAIAAADLNGDGKLDLVVPDYVGAASGQVAILLGNGDGTFQAPTFLTCGGGSTGVVLADFNKDGKLDLAVANQFGTIDVFLGNGNGTFNAPLVLNDVQANIGNPIPVSLAAADFNLDGNLDLLVGTIAGGSVQFTGPSAAPAGLQVFLGNGDGTFTGPQDYLAGAQSNPALVADLNGDGAPDVAAGDPSESFVSVLLNQTPPPVSVSPKNLSFTNQLVGTASATQPIMVKNNGAAATTITIAASGDFTQTNTCPVSPATLAVAANCTINVAFKPTATGARNGSITVTDPLPGSPQTVALSGTGIAPFVTLGSSSVTFGNQIVGTSSSQQTISLQNTGTAALMFSGAGITITGTNSGDFSQTNTCGASVAAGASCNINITFKPAAAGARSASLTINDDAANSPQNVPLSGTGVAPVVGLSAASLTFASQPVGTTSATQNITLTNTGNATLTFSGTGIAISGTNSGDFSQTNTCGATVAAAATCTISVTFKPTATGTRTASLSITDDAGNSPQSVSLSGTGVPAAPVASLSATSISFGNQLVGTSSSAQSVTLTNTGNVTLNFSGSGITISGANSGDFSQTNTCSTSVAAGANCTISVTFKPTATGHRSASVSITDNASGSPQSISLTGTGVAPAVTLSGNSLTFAGQLITTTSSPQSITLTNSGTAPLTISSIAVTGTNASDFAQTNTCPASTATLAPNISCSISVTFTPSATASRTASVTITHNASGSPQTVTLAGTGTDFSLAAASGANCPSGGNCSTSATISAGQSATYDLQATPSNGFNGNVALACSGAPGASTCTVSPASVPPAGSASYAFTVTVSNTANVMLVPQPPFRSIPGVPSSYALLVLPVLLFVVWAARPGVNHICARRILVPVAALLFFCVFYSIGCGGGGGGGGPQPPTNAVLKVTGTSSGVNRTVNLNLTVNH